MERTKTTEQAMAYFNNGYNCSQSVLLAHAEQVGVEPGVAAKVAAPFGAGIGYMGSTCGAVTGALMAIGLRYGDETGEDAEAKERVHEKTQAFLSSFEARHGSVACRELLGLDLSTAEGLASAREEGLFETECPGFVASAAEILEEILDGG